MDNPYSPVKPKLLWNAAADQIRALIEGGQIPVGSRLPGERELCVRLGISRISLREALRVLQYSGYVETRPGSGTYARLPEPATADAALNWITKDLTVFKLFELRQAVEPGIAGMAARHHSAKHADAMAAAIAEMSESASDRDRAVAADAEFHRLVGHSIGNRAISRLIDQIQNEGGQERRISLVVPGQVERAAAGHREILDRIRLRDEEGARVAMRKHLDDALDWIVAFSTPSPDKTQEER